MQKLGPNLSTVGGPGQQRVPESCRSSRSTLECAPWRLRNRHREPARAYKSRAKQNPYLQMQIGVSEVNLDDDLLSHGETPHYHRRCIVSLLSSGWDQVVPMLYGRQEIR